MFIKSLDLSDYRNYEDLKISFDPQVNIIYGNNAQGKTNILESIYLSATTKSQRGSKDKEIIRFSKDEAHIKLVLNKKDKDHIIDYHLRKIGKKSVSINKVPVKNARQIMGFMNVVFFSPEDLGIIKESPSKRRRFIDMELCQLDRVYLDDLTKYNKLLKQRNSLLKENNIKESKELLEVYDIQIINYGLSIIKKRKEFVDELNHMIKDIHLDLTSYRENLKVVYEPDADNDDYEKKFHDSLEKDRILKTTNVGPHRDDIGFYIDGIDARTYGSQGQQRSCALSLKLSELMIIKKKTNDTPILLLDDVLSELDSDRQESLLNGIQNVQTIITCTGLDDFVKKHLKKYKSFYINNNNAYEHNNSF